MPLSMVSLGMLLAFALAITWASLKLFAGSGPPSFTATAISLPMIVKIFPFAASFFSFLCLIFANFECPDISLCPFFMRRFSVLLLADTVWIMRSFTSIIRNVYPPYSNSKSSPSSGICSSREITKPLTVSNGSSSKETCSFSSSSSSGIIP